MTLRIPLGPSGIVGAPDGSADKMRRYFAPLSNAGNLPPSCTVTCTPSMLMLPPCLASTNSPSFNGSSSDGGRATLEHDEQTVLFWDNSSKGLNLYQVIIFDSPSKT